MSCAVRLFNLFTALCLGLAATPARADTARLLDGFEDVTAWQALASDGVKAAALGVEGKQGRAMRLDFDFGGVGGYAFARRVLPLDLPENYEISFYLRADAPVNNFEFKLTDASGENVWWNSRRNFVFPHGWQLVRIRKRQIDFAWGPTKDKTLRHAERIEFVISAGQGGGKGSVYIDQLSLRELPPETISRLAPSVGASSSLPQADPALVFDGLRATLWKSDPAQGIEQQLTVDFGAPREFGGLVLRWQDGAYASRYDVEYSDDGVGWRTVRRVIAGNGGTDALLLTESETRYLRLSLHDGPARAYALAEIEIKDLAYGATPNAFFQAQVETLRRGLLPRGFSGEQAYWTILAGDGGGASGLLSEDGALEVGKGGYTIEPYVLAGSETTTWADVTVSHSLLDNYLPIPSVTWRHPQWTLRVTAFAVGSRADSQLLARYELRNLTGDALPLKLVLAARPFQANPPSQFLNTPGGVSPIHDLAWDGTALAVNGKSQVFPLDRPAFVRTLPYDAFDSFDPAALVDGARGPQKLHDASGHATALLVYPLLLQPHAKATFNLVVALAGPARQPVLAGLSPKAWMARQERTVANAWRKKLNRVALRVPPAGQPLIDTLRSSLAHILMMRDGPALQPGTRSYDRSWIRDGAMISEGLLRLGEERTVAEYLRWFAPHQFANGKVPCCVDKRGADPVPENDSHGQLIFLAAELYRYTQDMAQLASIWPHVDAAARYMESLRQSERSAANLAPERQAFYGLMPASISHEGYSEKPMHSYWDDFWALKGYKDAVTIATVLGRDDDAARLVRQRDEFRQDLYASLRASTATHRIAYLPGAAELGDFDPTSTTIALAPGGEQRQLPQDLLYGTYERYWSEFLARREGRMKWEDYTPYELRTVGTFVRLGWRERAHELLDFFMAARRPAAWNQWAEVVGRDPRKPRFIGDLPHGWVASDYIRSALDLFAYEREADHALVLAAGIPEKWLEGTEVAVTNLRTAYGPLSYSLRKHGKRTVLELAAGPRLPPGGMVLALPGRAPAALRINGKTAIRQAGELRIDELPAKVIIDER